MKVQFFFYLALLSVVFDIVKKKFISSKKSRFRIFRNSVEIKTFTSSLVGAVTAIVICNKKKMNTRFRNTIIPSAFRFLEMDLRILTKKKKKFYYTTKWLMCVHVNLPIRRTRLLEFAQFLHTHTDDVIQSSIIARPPFRGEELPSRAANRKFITLLLKAHGDKMRIILSGWKKSILQLAQLKNVWV